MLMVRAEFKPCHEVHTAYNSQRNIYFRRYKQADIANYKVNGSALEVQLAVVLGASGIQWCSSSAVLLLPQLFVHQNWYVICWSSDPLRTVVLTWVYSFIPLIISCHSQSPRVAGSVRLPYRQAVTGCPQGVLGSIQGRLSHFQGDCPAFFRGLSLRLFPAPTISGVSLPFLYSS